VIYWFPCAVMFVLFAVGNELGWNIHNSIWLIFLAYIEFWCMYQGMKWQAPSVPSKPSPVRILNFSSGQLTIYLTPPEDNGSKILDYIVLMEEPESGNARMVYCGLSTLIVLKCHELNMKPGQPYTFTSSARNRIGIGPHSGASDPFILHASEPDQPIEPEIVLEKDSVRVRWNYPNDNGSQITHYKITVNIPDETLHEEQTATVLVDGEQQQCLFTDLNPEITYTIRLQATNAVGDSEMSEPVEFRIFPAPGTPSTTSLLDIEKSASGYF